MYQELLPYSIRIWPAPTTFANGAPVLSLGQPWRFDPDCLRFIHLTVSPGDAIATLMAFSPSGYHSDLAKALQPALYEVLSFFKVYLPKPDGASVTGKASPHGVFTFWPQLLLWFPGHRGYWFPLWLNICHQTLHITLRRSH